jgi:thymidylate synthase
MKPLNDFIEDFRVEILQKGVTQKDDRFNRIVKSLKFQAASIYSSDMLDYIKSTNRLPKYDKDWERMEDSFLYCVREYWKTPLSRRMVVSNMDFYEDVFPCFLTMQFLAIDENSVQVIVYQRSQDIVKMHDDLVYFGNVIKKFETGTGSKVTKLNVIYGDLHTKTK